MIFYHNQWSVGIYLSSFRELERRDFYTQPSYSVKFSPSHNFFITEPLRLLISLKVVINFVELYYL